jgi:hypothetical protein
MPRTDGPTQLNLGHALERSAFEREGARRPSASPGARASAQRRVDEELHRPGSGIKSAARLEAEAMVEGELREWLERMPVGAEFQASDFTAHLQAVGAIPDAKVYDLRSTGGVFKRLIAADVLRVIDYRPNCGCKERGYNATPRAVYELARHPREGEL